MKIELVSFENRTHESEARSSEICKTFFEIPVYIAWIKVCVYLSD